jgi:hypothetical protein
MDDKAQKIRDFLKSKGQWVCFCTYLYATPNTIDIGGEEILTLEYWTCEVGGGDIYLYETATTWPKLVEKVEHRLGVFGYFA